MALSLGEVVFNFGSNTLEGNTTKLEFQPDVGGCPCLFFSTTDKTHLEHLKECIALRPVYGKAGRRKFVKVMNFAFALTVSIDTMDDLERLILGDGLYGSVSKEEKQVIYRFIAACMQYYQEKREEIDNG